MCGIVGVVNSASADKSWLAEAGLSIQHRGPDDLGGWCSADGRVEFAHRRLSIIDLSAAAHQPMRTTDEKISIVFNGEIYNFVDLRTELIGAGHRFRSNSDTEIILAAYREWGIDCVVRFNGMFAFGLYDAEQGRLFLARDRAGEKPLFYTVRDRSLAFASELKALLADKTADRRIDHAAFDCFLTFGFVPSPRCLLRGFHKLPPAHALTFNVHTADLRVWRYWQLPDPVSPPPSESELLEELEQLMSDAVRRQLIADVPVGVLLSGGVDSSLVTAFAVRSKPDLNTFTVRFPGYRAYDETEHARLISRHFKTNHIELEATDPPVSVLRTLARQFDEPIVDSSMVPTYLVSRLTREHCKVALGGDGGDELFAGYPHYPWFLRLQRASRPLPRFLRKTAATVANQVLPVGFKGRNWTQALAVELDQDLPHVAALFPQRTRRHLLSRYPVWPTIGESVWRERIPRSNDLLQRATRMDFNNFLPEDILVKVDRASMVNSLEVRAPLLDYRIIEFAFGKVPSHLKANERDRKILLKRLANRLLPPEFDAKRKQGFSIPLSHWLRSGPWQEFFTSVLTDPAAIFDRNAVQALLRGQAKGQRNSERLFGLVIFELWRREYHITM